ncbi:hypothetical protein [Chitinophaga sp. HK235]|uniref:hypothetical protein n=1 Tax=Chitinophaga sp. HK235 TaxID=2952571 RepID=UPI001BA50335|nr:hypothetical protein [Chitinophaga sp. HK235]
MPNSIQPAKAPALLMPATIHYPGKHARGLNVMDGTGILSLAVILPFDVPRMQ